MEKLNSVQLGRSSVAQTYVERPLLLDGTKFDLRLYVVVTEVHPHLKGLLFKEGLARFCTQKWRGAAHHDARNCAESSHLTNYSLNKKSSKYKDGRSKRLLSTVLALLQKRYKGQFCVDRFWSQMEEMMHGALLAISPALLAEHAAGRALGAAQENVTYNHVLGVDVLLDQVSFCMRGFRYLIFKPCSVGCWTINLPGLQAVAAGTERHSEVLNKSNPLKSFRSLSIEKILAAEGSSSEATVHS